MDSQAISQDFCQCLGNTRNYHRPCRSSTFALTEEHWECICHGNGFNYQQIMLLVFRLTDQLQSYKGQHCGLIWRHGHRLLRDMQTSLRQCSHRTCSVKEICRLLESGFANSDRMTCRFMNIPDGCSGVMIQRAARNIGIWVFVSDEAVYFSISDSLLPPLSLNQLSRDSEGTLV